MLSTLILALLPAALPQSDVRYAEIAVDKTAIRSFYDNKSATVLEVGKGFPVQVVAELVPWSKVRVPGGYDVWVHQDYVEFEGGLGTITSNRVRIRPLPSTSAESHALGHFNKGDRVTRLGADGEWVKVRYHERVAAWVLTKNLLFPERELSQWQRIWTRMADSREVVPLPEITEEVEQQQGEEVTAEQAESAEVVSVEEGSLATVTESSNAAGEGVTDLVAAQAWVPFRAAQVAIEPGKYLALADERLQVIAAAVTKSNDHWDRAKIDNLELVYGNIIWHSSERKQVDAARAALIRIEGLRRFYLASLASGARRAELAGDMVLAGLLRKQRDEELRPRVPQDGGTSVEVGWVEYHPKVSARIPFVVARGNRSIPLHSYDGHQNLREFINREIVVRGTWRKDDSVLGGRVLAITELRVLPTRRK